MNGKSPAARRTYNDPFPVRLRELLDRKRGGQKELARHLGKTSQAVGYYKDGSTLPDCGVLASIADFYGVSTDYLLGRTDVASPDVTSQAASRRYGLSEESLRTLEDLSDVETWGLELLLQSEHLRELLRSVGNCYASRQEIAFEEALVSVNHSDVITLYDMEVQETDDGKKQALASVRVELSRLQKKIRQQAENAEANAVISLQRIAAQLGEEICALSRERGVPREEEPRE